MMLFAVMPASALNGKLEVHYLSSREELEAFVAATIASVRVIFYDVPPGTIAVQL
jgi:hypothetical protein